MVEWSIMKLVAAPFMCHQVWLKIVCWRLHQKVNFQWFWFRFHILRLQHLNVRVSKHRCCSLWDSEWAGSWVIIKTVTFKHRLSPLLFALLPWLLPDSVLCVSGLYIWGSAHDRNRAAISVYTPELTSASTHLYIHHQHLET